MISARAKGYKATRAWEFSRRCGTSYVLTYCALISACANGDKAAWALELFQEMLDPDLGPSSRVCFGPLCHEVCASASVPSLPPRTGLGLCA